MIQYFHPHLRLTRILTGRLATSGFPVLGLPKHSDEGRQIRRLVKAPEGCSILSVDYSQIELRVAAQLSQDSSMVQAFQDGVDIHGLTAWKIFGVPIEQQEESLHRLPSKAANFGYWMGLQEKGLTEQIHKAAGNLKDPKARAQVLKWSAKCPGCKSFKAPHDADCDSLRFFQTYNEQFPGARQFQADRKAYATETGYAYGLWGERWFLPAAWAADEMVREGALRQAHALPIQSGAQRLIKRAMRVIHEETLPALRQQDIDIVPILQVHDELLFVVETAAVPTAYTAVKATMESQVEWAVPIKADGKAGPSWGELAKSPLR
jgi:DNA polymerase I